VAERSLKLGIDASGAKVGADEYARAIATVRAHNQQAVAGVREVERAFDVQGRTAQTTGSTIATAFQRTATSIASSGGSIRGILGGITSEISGVASGAGGMTESLGLSAGALSALGVGAGIVTSLGAAIGFTAREALQLETALRLVVARTDPSQLNRYREAAISLAEGSGATQEQAAEAITQAVVAGFSTFESQLDIARRAIALTRTEAIGAAAAVQSLDGVMDAFGLTAEHAGEVTDKLVVAARLGEKPFGDMATAAETAGARLSQLGIDLDEVLSALTLITPRSSSATQAGQSLATLFTRLSSTSDPLQEKLQDLGYTINADTIAIDGIVGTLQKLRDATEGQPTLKADLFPDARSARAVLAGLAEVETKGKAAQEAIASAAGAQQEAFAKVARLPSEELDRLQEGASGLFTRIGVAIENAYSKASQFNRDGSLFDIGAPLRIWAQSVDEAFTQVEEKAKSTFESIRQEATNAGTGNDWDAGFVAPKPPPPEPPRRNLPPARSPIGPEFNRDLERATAESEALSRAIQEKLGTALEQEAAKLRNGEIEIRRKIASYEALGIPVEGLQAQLFALVQANDATIGSMRRSELAEKLAADSHRRAGEAAFAYSKTLHGLRGDVESIGLAHYGAVQGVVALTKAITERIAAGQQAFEEGPSRVVEDYQFQATLIGKTADEQERLTALRQFDVEALRAQSEALKLNADGLTTIDKELADARARLENALDESELRRKSEAVAHAFADPIAQGVEAWPIGLASIEDAVEQTVRQIIASLVRVNITQPLQQGLLGLFAPGAQAVYGPPAPSYMGNVFSRGEIVPHAFGGVPDIGNQEALFPMSGGRTGSLREGGRTEAIMPVIARAPTGELGVKLVGGSTGGNVTNVRNFDVKINLSSPGDERSRRQLVNDLQRLARTE